MTLAEDVKKVLLETADALTGHARRLFMARTVRDLFGGVLNRAVRVLHWDERILRKGLHELRTGIECLDGHTGTGRPRTEIRLPTLRRDLRDVADGQSQIDPRFQNQRLYTRLTAAEARRQLIAQKGYTDAALPSVETIRVTLNELGFRLRKVAKVRPKKRFPRPTRSSPG